MSFIKILLTHQNIDITVCTILAHIAHGTKQIDYHHVMNIDKADFILLLEMAQLVTKIGSSDRERFCRVLSMYRKIATLNIVYHYQKHWNDVVLWY